MAEDTLKLKIDIEKQDAEQALDELQEKAQIELGIDTNEAEKNLDNVNDKLDEVADKSEEAGQKISKGLVAAFGYAVKEAGDLLIMAGKLGEAQSEGPSWWDRAKKYAGGALKGAMAGAAVGGAGGALLGGVGAAPGAIVGAVAGAISGAGKELYKDVIKDEKDYNKQMDQLDKQNLKANEQRQKEAAKAEEKAAKEKEKADRQREREEAKAAKQKEREEAKAAKERQRAEEKAAKEKQKAEAELNKQMKADYIASIDKQLEDEKKKGGDIKTAMGILSDSQSSVFSQLAKMGLYANAADISNIGGAENYQQRMVDLAKQLVDSMNEQVRLTAEKNEVKTVWH